MSIALVSVEGVVGDEDAFQGFHPLLFGLRLVKALASEYRVVFATVQQDTDAVKRWLMINGLSMPHSYEDLRAAELVADDFLEPVVRVAQSLRAQGHDLGLVVSAEPRAILDVTKMGVPSLFFVNPAFRWGEYQIGDMPKRWSEIEAEITRQRLAKAASQESE